MSNFMIKMSELCSKCKDGCYNDCKTCKSDLCPSKKRGGECKCSSGCSKKGGNK